MDKSAAEYISDILFEFLHSLLLKPIGSAFRLDAGAAPSWTPTTPGSTVSPATNCAMLRTFRPGSQRSLREGFPWGDFLRAEGEGNQAVWGVSDETSRECSEWRRGMGCLGNLVVR